MRRTMWQAMIVVILSSPAALAADPPGDAVPALDAAATDAVKACQMTEKPKAAEAACRSAIESGTWQGKEQSWAWNNLGLAQAAQARWRDALKAYDRALELAPNYAAALSNRGNVHAALGDMDRAFADHDRAVGLDPDYVAALHNRGVDHEEMGNPQAALADYRAVLKLAPGHKGAHIGLSTANCRLGRVKASAEARLVAIRKGHLDATTMQELLKRAGHYRGKIDGIFGKGSRAALWTWTRRGCLAPA